MLGWCVACMYVCAFAHSRGAYRQLQPLARAGDEPGQKPPELDNREAGEAVDEEFVKLRVCGYTCMWNQRLGSVSPFITRRPSHFTHGPGLTSGPPPEARIPTRLNINEAITKTRLQNRSIVRRKCSVAAGVQGHVQMGP